MDITVSASAVAWYGAIVATGSLGLGLFLALRDAPRVKVSAGIDYRVTSPAAGYDPSKTYIVVTLANAGRRPVTITKVWLEMKTTPHSILGDSIRRGFTELAEGKSASFLVEQADINLAAVKKVVALDATGRKWGGRIQRN